MQFLIKFTFIAVIIGCTNYSVSGQNTQPAHIIDTNSKAMVFAPGVVSTPFEEAAATFSPDGNTVFFYQGTNYMTVCFSKQVNGKWTKPQVAPFSGKWSDWDPFLSPDGKRLFFVSNRPLESASPGNAPKKSHLWYADRLGGDKWSAPRSITDAFNLDGISNYAPSVSNSGTLFFYSPERDKNGHRKSFYAKWLGDHYDGPKELTLNGDDEVSDPFIAPDESYLIFVSGNDIYISFKQGDDWAAGQKLGPQVNNGDANWDPTVSPDGKILYYTSARVQGFYKRDQQGPALIMMDC
jgi:Tol biopolymer transport system component